MDEKIILGALSSDLKRVAMSLYRNSQVVADRFLEEAIKRKKEIKKNSLPPYLSFLLNKIKKKMVAEDALMYSTLIQNYVLSRNH